MIKYDFTKPLTWVVVPSEDEELAAATGAVHERLMCGTEELAWIQQFMSGGSVYGGSILIQRTGPTDMSLQEMRDYLEANVRTFTGPDTAGSA